MLNKPLSHIRPLLRLPSHPAPSPEHFTPNPSLLHHLPQNGAGNAVVSQAQSAAQAAGNGSGGAGKTGYGGGSAGTGNGGYTGHARAFLSLPQTSGTDATSSLNTDENSRSESSTSARRSSLLLKHRIAKHAQIVGPAAEGVRRGVRREIEARAGSSRMKVMEVDEAPAGEPNDRLLEGPSSPSRICRRSSIAFPAALDLPPSPRSTYISPLPSSRPVHTPRSSSPRVLSAHSRSPTPTSATDRSDILGRSRTGLDIWQVGFSRSRSQLSVRNYTTPPDPTTLLLEEDEEIRRLRTSTPPQPSRALHQSGPVFMDLAGVDLPILSKRVGQVRRNSTATMEQTPEADEVSQDQDHEPDIEDDVVQEKSSAELLSENTIRDKRIHQALFQAGKDRDRPKVISLIRHYRSSRKPSPFSTTDDLGDPTHSQSLPLPSGYTTHTYNSCLDALNYTRKPGSSIAKVLEIYNEMLERDLIPDTTTYTHVIVALCARESDVWTSVKQWEDEKRWGKWTEQKVGERWDEERAAEKDLIIEGYKAENNYKSAVKLFSAASLITHHKRDLRFIYHTLLDVGGMQPEPDLELLMQIFQGAQLSRTYGRRSLYKPLFRAFGATKDLERLKELWTRFEESEKQGGGVEPLEWLRRSAQNLGGYRKTPELICQTYARATWGAAIHAFIRAGDADFAIEIFEKMLASPVLGMGVQPDLTIPPYVTQLRAADFLVVLVHNGYADKALEWYPRILESLRGLSETSMGPSHFYDLIDGLVWAGKWREATPLVKEWLFARMTGADTNSTIVIGRFGHLHTLIVSEASKLAASGGDPDEIVGILNATTSLLPEKQALDGIAKRPEFLMTLPSYVIDAHCDLLIKLKRYADLIPLMELFSTDKEDYMHLQTMIFRRIASSESSLADLCEVVKLIAEHDTKLSFFSADALIRRYIKGRASVNTASDLGLKSIDWNQIMGGIVWLPPNNLASGAYDEHIIQFMDDSQEIKAVSEADFWIEEGPEKYASLSTILVDRFGLERAKAMSIAAYGEQRTEAWLPKQLLSVPSEVSSGEESSVFSNTPTPESMSTPPDTNSVLSESLTSGLPPLTLNPALTRLISVGNDPTTAPSTQRTYEILLEGYNRGEVVYPDVLQRFMVTLSREGEEHKVRKIYEIGHQAIGSAIPPERQQRAWHTMEDGMLMASCHLGHLEQAGMHRARLVEAGMAPSADAYATMISCSKDTTDDALVARELFDESRAMGVAPNLFLFNTIISKLSKARKADMALDLFKHMKSINVQTSSVTYGALINACCRVGDAESAKTLFNEMTVQKGFKPKAPPFNTMMQFHLTTQPSRERVLYYYTALCKARVAPSAHTYKLLLDAYAVLPPSDLQSMERVFAELVADPKVPVQSTHWASLITAHGIFDDDLAKAMETFESIPHHPSTERRAIAADPVIWESILNVVSNKGSVEQLIAMRQRMLETGVKATAYVNNVLISGLARAGLIDQAREVFENMGDSVTGVAAPNNHPTLLTSSGHVKPATVTATPTQMVYREPSTYEAMIRAEIQAGTREAAESICKRMEERRYPVAVFMRARAILDEQPGVSPLPGTGGEGSHLPNMYVPHPEHILAEQVPAS